MATESNRTSPAFPAWKAFVVQFATDAHIRGPKCSGRVEHLNSGRRVRFDSREELIAALTQILDELDESAR